jgi:MFS family permease
MSAADASPFAAFGYRDYRLLQSAKIASVIGVQMQSVAVGLQVKDLTHRALDLGFVGLMQFLPFVALSLAAGHVADRFARRRVLAICHGSVALVSLALCANARSGGGGVAPIYALLLLFGTARVFAGPAAQSMLPNLVAKQHFGNAVAWSSALWQACTIVGPAIGGFLYALGPASVYAASAALSASSMTLVLLMRPREIARKSEPATLQTLFAGVRFVWKKKLILGSITLDLFAVLFGGAVALLPIFADRLGVGPVGFGVLRSAPAVGAACTAIALAFRPLRRRSGAWMFACVGIFGVATVGFGLSTSFALSLAMLAITGAVDMVSVAVRQTLVQIETPDEMRGRVSAVNLVFVGASNELGEFESGVTAEWLGPVRAVVAGGVGTVIVVLACAGLFPELRKVDRLGS